MIVTAKEDYFFLAAVFFLAAGFFAAAFLAAFFAM
jgi:hypothetical protein